MLAYTPAQLRSICSVKVRLCRPQHNDVIARVVSLGLRRSTRRGSRAGRRCNKRSINSIIGDAVTSQVVSPSRSNEHDQLFTVGSQPKRWMLPSFLLTNLRSLTNKLDDFETVVRLNNSDVVCLTETWLSVNVPSESVSMNGFSLFRKDRDRQGGGVACYVRASIPCTVLTDFDEPGLETLWIMLRPARMPRWLTHVVVGVIYHPPNANNRRMIDHILNTIEQISRVHPNSGVAVVGDFNRLPDGPLRNYPLRQVVRGTTRKGALLDKM